MLHWITHQNEKSSVVTAITRHTLARNPLMGRILATAQLAVMIFYGLSTSVVARSDDFRLQTWGTDSDLAHPTVVALAQTNDGYLWAATLQGVSRFDGIRFKNFGSGAHPSLVHTSALAGGSGTTLWIGTRHGEILSFS